MLEMQPPIFARSRPGRRGFDLPAAGVPATSDSEGRSGSLAGLLGEVEMRDEPPRLPELAEPEVVRHYTNLSQLNHGVDTGFYPLGSCTMKYNPKVNDELAGLPGFAELHPYQAAEDVQGTLQAMWELEQQLLELTGMRRASLQPAAGAHGELVGILMIRSWQRDRSEGHRDTVIVPDSAHGTNLATASMAGYKVVEMPSSAQGLIDLGALEEALSRHRVSALMLTNPNTLGLFEEDILEISRLTHEAGALIYYDGANLNAILGKAKPGEMGMDVMHVNLHKTFSTPHGGGGPGAGPVAVGENLEPYLPGPLVARRAGYAGTGRAADNKDSAGTDRSPEFYFEREQPKSIGRVRGFYGNVGVLIRALAYIISMGGDGLLQATEDAVLNANYLRARLRDTYEIPYDRLVMHEFVASASRQKSYGVNARDVAKRILDSGMHAPSIYFPLIVPEALMIEPTETENRDTLDAFVEVMRQIDRESRENPELVQTAPHTTPVRRPDEVLAARRPVLRWQPGDPVNG